MNGKTEKKQTKNVPGTETVLKKMTTCFFSPKTTTENGRKKKRNGSDPICKGYLTTFSLVRPPSWNKHIMGKQEWPKR